MARRPTLVAASALALLVPVAACTDRASSGADAPATSQLAVDQSYFPGTGDASLDVLSYDVDATVDIEGTDHLDAVAELRIEALDDLDRIRLDLSGLEVREVRVDGRVAPHRTTDGHLVVTPDGPIERGRRLTVRVDYGGEPAGGSEPLSTLEEDGGGWLDLGAYSVVVAEPVGASTWLPVNDLPSDKAVLSLDVTVPSPLEAVSNGLLEGSTVDSSAGTTTFRWRAQEPMAPYLMTLAVGEFTLMDSSMPGGVVRTDAVPPELAPDVSAELARFPEMLAYLEQHLGAYPFVAAGNVVVPGMPPTALETQTRSVLSLAALEQPDPDQLLVHELAHQWFGDSVTPATWADIWLNEGPAVYWQWRWAQSRGGPTAEESARRSWDAADDSMDVPPANPGEDELFGRSVYERSAMFLVELERLMGDAPFGELLRTWLDEHAGGTGTTEQFVQLAGEVHGSPITDLSEPWLHGDELPDLSF